MGCSSWVPVLFLHKNLKTWKKLFRPKPRFLQRWQIGLLLCAEWGIINRTITIHIAAEYHGSADWTDNFQAARSLADLARGLSLISLSVGVTMFLVTGCQWHFISCLMSSAEWVTEGSLRWSVIAMLALASMSMAWKCRLIMRSSSEWKLMATQSPAGRSSRWAAWSPESSSLSSLLTNIRRAWNVLVAQCDRLPSLSLCIANLPSQHQHHSSIYSKWTYRVNGGNYFTFFFSFFLEYV